MLWLGLAVPGQSGDVLLTAGKLRPVGEAGYQVTGLALPDLGGEPIVGLDRNDPAARLLRHVARTSEANGHRGVLYDNRDRGHSELPRSAFPGLAHLAYALELRGSDFGLALDYRFPYVVLGNSSTALTSGYKPRSLMRIAMTEPGLARRAFALAANNHLYVYPEHRDHDGTDLYPANWAYMVTSQGSSGSDQPFLDAFAMTLAAFSEETMDAMREEGLVVPTMQMILRRNLSQVDGLSAYYSGLAHPTVFDASRLRVERMIGHAAALEPETIPPMVRLAIVSEDFRGEAGLAGRSERLFTTPSAIARIWRGFEGRKEITLSAAATSSRTDTPLSFRWVILRGDADRISISPDATGARARITLEWHDAFQIPSRGGPLTTSRIDIGVFAETGGEPSAPAFFSVSFPTHQDRSYGTDAEGAPALNSVDYDAAARGVDFDPVIHWTAPWMDRAVRDGSGNIVGWMRTDAAGTRRVGAGENGPGYEIIDTQTPRPILVEVRP